MEHSALDRILDHLLVRNFRAYCWSAQHRNNSQSLPTAGAPSRRSQVRRVARQHSAAHTHGFPTDGAGAVLVLLAVLVPGHDFTR